MEYSIVIPAYNEADKITSSLTQIMGFMKTFSPSFEVLVVDDGSKDNTATLVEDYAKNIPEIRLIRNSHKGKGPALWRGVVESAGEYIYLCDADLSTPIDELKKFAIWVKDHNFDIVIGSREGSGAKRIDEPFYRHLMGRIFNYWVQLIALRGIKDSQCGFKLFKNDAAKHIFGMLKIYGEDAKEIKKAYMGVFDVEVLFLARKSGYKIKELPVTWTHVRTTRLNPISDSFNMAKDVLKVRINYLRRVYSE
jgi:dolichyl-phosphate beta-glucosyltransferase